MATASIRRISLAGSVVALPRVHVPAHRRHVAVVPQDGALFPHLSVAENVGFGLRRRRPGRMARIQECLELVDLAGHGERMPHELSGGEQQRVAIARASVNRPTSTRLSTSSRVATARWSGSAANMTLELRAGGCFCERWGDSSVEHLHIVRAEPGRALVGRGGLGPPLDLGAAGVLGWSLEPLDGGRATRLVQSYRVGGLLPGDASKLAPLVDAVLGEQLARLKAHVEAGVPAR